MRFCSLGSGSAGNATLIEAHSGQTTTRVLVDCGFSLRELSLRLDRLGLSPHDIDAVFITHEHGDHVGCALALARKHGVALWTSRGTWSAIANNKGAEAVVPNFTRDGDVFSVRDLEFRPFTVPHDANEPLQLRVTDGAYQLGLLTDAGSVTPHLLGQLERLDGLILECNHDRDLLARSAYPASLKARVGGRFGHLANDSAASVLGHIHHPGLKHVVAAHLSTQNNRPELAMQALASALGTHSRDIVVAEQILGFNWLG